MVKKKKKINPWIIIGAIILVIILYNYTDLFSLTTFLPENQVEYEDYTSNDIMVGTTTTTVTNDYWVFTGNDFIVDYDTNKIRMWLVLSYKNCGTDGGNTCPSILTVTSTNNFYRKDMTIVLSSPFVPNSEGGGGTGTSFVYGECSFSLESNNVIQVRWDYDSDRYVVFNNGLLKCDKTTSQKDIIVGFELTPVYQGTCGFNCKYFSSPTVTISVVGFGEPEESFGTRIRTEDLPSFVLNPGESVSHEFVFDILGMISGSKGRFELGISALPEEETIPRSIGYDIEVIKE